MRRFWLGVVLCAAAVVPPASGSAQTYPSRVVRIIVPFPPGSGTDILSRMISEQLSRKWNASVITENGPGASGNIGAAEVFRAAPDGHTLMIAPPGPISTNKFLFKELAYDPARWVAISWLASVPYVLIVPTAADGGFKELMARAKANPGKVTTAVPGPGGTAHLSVAYLEAMAGIKFLYVPYRGLGPAINDIVAGHVDSMFDTFTTSLPQHKGGRVKMVAVASTKRNPVLPDVPAIAEFYPGYRSITWFGLVAPPGTPDAIADKISRDVGEILRQPDVNARLREMQMEPVGSTRAEARRFFDDEAELWGKVIRDANITLQ